MSNDVAFFTFSLNDTEVFPMSLIAIWSTLHQRPIISGCPAGTAGNGRCCIKDSDGKVSLKAGADNDYYCHSGNQLELIQSMTSPS